jgi:hypothetical protein
MFASLQEHVTPRGFDAFSGLRRQWDREQQAVEKAKAHNEVLQQFAPTRFQVGQVVLTDLGRRVRIVEVHPKGYISIPSKYDVFGRWTQPVTCDCNIYQYVDVASPSSGRSQTVEDRLSPEPGR